MSLEDSIKSIEHTLGQFDNTNEQTSNHENPEQNQQKDILLKASEIHNKLKALSENKEKPNEDSKILEEIKEELKSFDNRHNLVSDDKKAEFENQIKNNNDAYQQTIQKLKNDNVVEVMSIKNQLENSIENLNKQH